MTETHKLSIQRWSKFDWFLQARHNAHLGDAAGDRPFLNWNRRGYSSTPYPIMQKYRIPNVFRELEPETIWFRKNIRTPLRDDPGVLFATMAFRSFNRIEAGQSLIASPSLLKKWDENEALSRLNGSIEDYQIINSIGFCAPKMDNIVGQIRGCSLKESWRKLTELTFEGTDSPYIGQALAYRIVCDLRHTYLLENAPDIFSWAYLDHPARKGLAHVTDHDDSSFSRVKKENREEVIQTLFWRAKKNYFGFGDWEMSDIIHALGAYGQYVGLEDWTPV